MPFFSSERHLVVVYSETPTLYQQYECFLFPYFQDLFVLETIFEIYFRHFIWFNCDKNIVITIKMNCTFGCLSFNMVLTMRLSRRVNIILFLAPRMCPASDFMVWIIL